MDDLFSVGADPFAGPEFADPMAAIRAAREAVADDPERLGAGGGKSAERASKGKSARAKGHDLANRTVAYYQSLGFLAFRVDYTIALWGGGVQSMDLLGFADVMAFGHGRLILSQVTVEEKRTDHERKLCDDTKRVPRILRTPYSLCMEAMAKGAEVHLVLWRKDGARWVHRIQEITPAWLADRAEKLSRRRAK